MAATDNITVPLPLPLTPDWIPIQFAALDAVQPQPASVVTSTDKRPPAASIVSCDRLSPNRHGAAAWVTLTRAVSTVIAPERVDGALLAATVNARDPAPCPLVVASATHDASADADQAQSRVAVMLMDPLPPVAGNAGGWPLRPISHLEAVGLVTEEVVELHVVETTAPDRTRDANVRRLHMARYPPPTTMHVARQQSPGTCRVGARHVPGTDPALGVRLGHPSIRS